MKIKKEFLTLPLSEIVPYENNPRDNDEAVPDVIASIKQTGNLDPIEIDEDNVILSGHTRFKALLELGYAETEVVRYSGMTKARKKKYRVLANKASEKSTWNLEKLEIELEGLDFEGFDFGFDFSSGAENHKWFDREKRDGAKREDGNAEYNDFLEKFEQKKTTDDCYTPDVIYEAAAEWVRAEYGLNRKNFVRPFYPGGDYQAFAYKSGSVVVDNPPFSILAEIISFYAENGIKFFLFAPTLTLFSSSSSSSECSICVGVSVTYENGANVDTSFVTNLEPDCRLRSAPTLYQALKEANDINLKEMRRELPKYTYSDYIITSTRCGQFSRYGIDYRVSVSESARIRQLDAQKESGKAIFGSAYLLSEKKKAEKEKAEREKAEREKAEREKAEREKAEREKAERWELSEREMQIVKSLG